MSMSRRPTLLDGPGRAGAGGPSDVKPPFMSQTSYFPDPQTSSSRTNRPCLGSSKFTQQRELCRNEAHGLPTTNKCSDQRPKGDRSVHPASVKTSYTG